MYKYVVEIYICILNLSLSLSLLLLVLLILLIIVTEVLTVVEWYHRLTLTECKTQLIGPGQG